jgi:phosphate transport system substrate-binding protein
MRRLFSVVAALVMTAAGVSGADAIRISGSTTVNAAVFAEHKAEIEAAVGGPIQVTANGSAIGLKDLVEGRADVAMLSSLLVKVAEKANIDPKGLNQFPLVDARLVFIVHPSNPVKAVTLDQVKGVLAGTITNRKALGGPDLPIVGVVEAVGGGVRVVTDEGVMHGTPVAATVKTAKGDKIAGIVKTTPGALGVASSLHDNAGTVAPTTDKAVPQMLVLIVKGAATPAIQKLVVAARAAAKS